MSLSVAPAATDVGGAINSISPLATSAAYAFSEKPVSAQDTMALANFFLFMIEASLCMAPRQSAG